MNLKTERKVKFWLGTLAKIAFFVLIVFKIYDYVASRKVENDSSKITYDIVEKDTLGQAGGIRKNVSPEDTSHSTKDPVNIPASNIDKEESITTINPNSVSIIIYDADGIDYQITNHLENTLFQKYDLGPPTIKALEKKDALLQGDFSVLGKIKTKYIVTGEVHYNFKESSLSSNTVSCQINLQYHTYDTSTNNKKRDLSKSIQRIGIGFSQEEAKVNAIKKI